MPTDAYDTLLRDFRWNLPARFNIAEACLEPRPGHDGSRPALLRFDGEALHPTSYAELRNLTERLAAALRERGIGRGDRVALLLPQSVEVVAGHFAAYRLGAIAVPLAALFGVDALRYRLATAGARALITDAAGLAKIAEIRGDLPDLDVVLCTDGAGPGAEGLREAMAANLPPVPPSDTGPDDPALMIFTSGTTGQPKGALHGHRVLLGHLPGFRFTHTPMPSESDRFWTPSDWAWAGGLLNCLLPALCLGVPVVFGHNRSFDPQAAFMLMERAGVRNAFLPPTALKMLRSVATPRTRYDLRLRTIGSAGESLGRDAFDWTMAELGVPANEFYGQTECNYVLGSSAAFGVSRAGATGKPIPGHEVAVLDGDGQPVPADTPGEIAIRRPDPVMFLEYWRDPEATAAKFRGDWMMTGDLATVDRDGYFHFLGRNDDIITSSGYRIGPSEIEDCLATHHAVLMAAVIGRPDKLRTEIVAAFVKLKPGFSGSPQLAEEIRLYVRARLSAAEYPREITFVDSIPMTTSGKVIRRHFRDGAGREPG